MARSSLAAATRGPTQLRTIGVWDLRRSAARMSSARPESSHGRLHRTPTLSCRTLGPDVFLKAELLQRTGSFKPRGVLTKLASLTSEEKSARRDRGLGGKPRGGARLRRSARRDRRARRHVPGRERGQAPGGRGIRRDDRPRGDRARRRLRAPCRAGAGDRTRARASVRRPARRRRPGHCRARDPRGRPRRRADRRAVRGRRARLRDRASPQQAPTSKSWPSNRSPPARCTQLSKRGSRARVDARTLADGLNAPFAGDLALEIAQAHGVGRCSSRRTRSPRASVSSTQRAKLACEPAGAAAVAALLAGKVEAANTVCVVSGGNVAAQTAAGILASP